MSKNTFNQIFTLYSATGEARSKFFGHAESAAVKPTIQPVIAADNTVKLTCNDIPKDCINLGDVATLEYIGKGRDLWPTYCPGLIAGYIYKNDPKKRQFMMMWALDGGDYEDRLHFYMCKNDSFISSFNGDGIFGKSGSIGQENGGGSGNGPAKT